MIHDLAPCEQCSRIQEIRELDIWDGICYYCYIKNTQQQEWKNGELRTEPSGTADCTDAVLDRDPQEASRDHA